MNIRSYPLSVKNEKTVKTLTMTEEYLEINNLAWIGRARQLGEIVLDRHPVLLDLGLDVAQLPLHLVAASHLADELPLEVVHVAVEL